MNCEFCNKRYDTVSLLNRHKKESLECLKIQGKNVSIVCEYCKKNYSSNNSLKKHIIICKIKIENEIKEKEKQIIYDYENIIETLKKQNIDITENYDEEINIKNKIINEQENEIIELKMTIAELTGKNKVYEVDLMKIAMQPRTTTNTNNNNIYNNLSVFDKDVLTERLNSTLQNITAEQLYEGQKSVAKILAPCLDNGDGTKMISCSDKSRGTLVSKDKNGNINKDFNAKNLVDVIHPIVLTKADEVNKNDMVKREKSYKLKSLKDDIEKRENEIEQFKATMKGFKKNTSQYLQHQEWIRGREEKNERDILEIEELEYEGVEEPRDDFVLYDEKLVEGIEDITKMKEDSTKFKNSLSKEI
jgi:hypothetical protein